MLNLVQISPIVFDVLGDYHSGVILFVTGSTGPGVRESRGVYLAPFLTYNLLINFMRSRGHVTTPT